MNHPSPSPASLRATKGSSEGTAEPRCRSIRSGCSRRASSRGMTMASPWSLAASNSPNSGSALPSLREGGYASMSSFERSVNSHPGTPLKDGSSGRAVTALANRALHLQLDQPVHLDRVLHRELLHDRLDEAVHDQLAGLLLGDAVRHQVVELLVAYLRDGGLVAHVHVVLADADRRVGVRARVLVEQQRIADDLRLGAVSALGDLEQPAVRGAPAVLRDRLREDVRGRVR